MAAAVRSAVVGGRLRLGIMILEVPEVLPDLGADVARNCQACSASWRRWPGGGILDGDLARLAGGGARRHGCPTEVPIVN
jgi:hypothetical protein